MRDRGGKLRPPNLKSHETALVHFRRVHLKIRATSMSLVSSKYLHTNDNNFIYRVSYLVSVFRSCAFPALRCDIIPLFALKGCAYSISLLNSPLYSVHSSRYEKLHRHGVHFQTILRRSFDYETHRYEGSAGRICLHAKPFSIAVDAYSTHRAKLCTNKESSDCCSSNHRIKYNTKTALLHSLFPAPGPTPPPFELPWVSLDG